MLIKTLLFIMICPALFAQNVGDRVIYKVDKFSGGLNLLDSLNLEPDEMLQADNFVLDRFLSLHKRYGIKNWNDSLISADTIKDVHYVEDKNGGKNLYIATNNYVYQLPGWKDSAKVWAGKEIDYTRGKIDTATNNGQKNIYGDTTSWIIAVAPGDKIRLQGGGAYYTIDTVYADTLIHVTANLAVTGDTFAGYRIVKKIKGNPQLSSWNGNLYVADGSNQPWWYNGTQPYLLGVIGSGTVTSAPTIDSTWSTYATGKAKILQSSNIVRFTGIDTANAAFTVGNIFHFTWYSFASRMTLNWSSRIISKRTLPDTAIVLNDMIGRFGYDFNDIPSRFTLPDSLYFSIRYWWISQANAIVSSDQYQYLGDSTKIWDTDQYVGCWLVNGKNALKGTKINANSDRTISFDSLGVGFTTGNKYYIVWQLPQLITRAIGTHNYHPGQFWRDSLFYNDIRFSQIYFHRNRLYAIGDEINYYDVRYFFDDTWYHSGDTVNMSRVWFSDLAEPYSIKDDYNFDISGSRISSIVSADACERIIGLMDNLYVITKNNIYEISGEPNVKLDGYDLYLRQIIPGVGTNQSLGVVTVKTNFAYIMNQEGIWLFDGNSIQKISYKIDPIIERYRGSRMTAGRFKDNLYFSYPDSNKTLLYFEPLQKFIGPWNVGMLAMNNQSVAIDSNYFLFSMSEDSGYVLRYPGTTNYFKDIFAPNDTAFYTARYKSGWFNPGQMQYRSTLEWLDVVAYNANVSSLLNLLRIRGDFLDTVLWDTAGFAGGNRFHHYRTGFANSYGKDIWQIEIMDSTSYDFFVSGYRVQAWLKGR